MIRNTTEKPRAFVGEWNGSYRLLVPIGERIGGVSEGLANSLTRPTRYTNMSLPQLLRARPMRAGTVKREKKDKTA